MDVYSQQWEIFLILFLPAKDIMPLPINIRSNRICADFNPIITRKLAKIWIEFIFEINVAYLNLRNKTLQLGIFQNGKLSTPEAIIRNSCIFWWIRFANLTPEHKRSLINLKLRKSTLISKGIVQILSRYILAWLLVTNFQMYQYINIF